jgi:large subunit ribosomal protein L28
MLHAQLRPPCQIRGSANSSFVRGNLAHAFQRLQVSSNNTVKSFQVLAAATSAEKKAAIAKKRARPAKQDVTGNKTSGRVCDLTGRRANNGYNVTFSHIRNKKMQQVNLQYKRVYWPEGQRWVKLRICSKAIKTLEKRGLQSMAAEAGIDLFKLPYNDVSKSRQEWLKENHKGHPAQPTKKVGKSRRMKNPEKLAASKKKPLMARYIAGSRVILTRDPRFVEEYKS